MPRRTITITRDEDGLFTATMGIPSEVDWAYKSDKKATAEEAVKAVQVMADEDKELRREINQLFRKPKGPVRPAGKQKPTPEWCCTCKHQNWVQDEVGRVGRCLRWAKEKDPFTAEIGENLKQKPSWCPGWEKASRRRGVIR